MKGAVQRPFVGHVVIAAVLLVSLAITRAVYVGPRDREKKALHEEEQQLRAELADLATGFQQMTAWAKEHPEQDLVTFRARRALPARDMVAAFLRGLVPIAERNQVGTELIEPRGAWTDAVVSDAEGHPVTYRKAELRFRIYAGYEALGDYVREIEAMDQLVVVREIEIQHHAPSEPRHVADVTIWLYGTP